MFCPLPRGSIVQSHANDVLPFAQKAFTNPKCWAEASSQLQMSGDAKSKSGWKKNATEYKLFHVTRGLHHQHHPRHRWVTRGRTKASRRCLTSWTDAPTAASESCAAEGGVRREEEGEREREGGDLPRSVCARERENQGRRRKPPCGRKEKALDE